MSQANHPVVQVTGLGKIFRDFWGRPKVRAIAGIGFEIQAGEVFGLLGPNGSGKSTTLKILLDLLHASSGTARLFGEPPDSLAVKREIGYLPEESYLYAYLTPRETLAFYARLFGLNRAECRTRVEQLLEMVGLTHAADRPVGEFSKGMARRVGLAQALINDPQLVILDEPTSGLDPIGCRQVKDLMLTLAKRGKTIILSSHLLADVEDVCDRIAILYNGEIRAHGRMSSLLEEPDRLSLRVPALAPQKLKRLLGLLREELGSEPLVEHPSMNLEQFFLRVVEEAHRTAPDQQAFSRATGVADYLSEPDT
jgi:ABC-2 type transport system ATP-binding protein